jgi:hypothetical protein
MTSRPISREGLAAAALPVVAIAVTVLTIAGALAASSAAGTLGFDYLAYDAAARRLLAGERLYDMSFAASGDFGLFYYPPPFILAVLPFALLPSTAATWAWIAMLVGAFVVGVALLPVPARVRWLVILAAGVQWPFLYAIKLGQVGPLLFLAFAAGWRWLAQPVAIGSAAAIGAAIKVQPVLLVAWAALVGRWRAVAVAIVAGIGLAVVATVLAGLGAWFDFLELVRRVSDPITTPKNFTPGAIAYQLGVDRSAAGLVQVAATLAVAVVVIVAARRASPDASFLVAVTASQLVSPILWEHYLVLTLLPMAWLLGRGHWWALAGPVLTSWLLDTPPIGYLAVLVAFFVAPWLLGGRTSRSSVMPATAPATPVVRG